MTSKRFKLLARDDQTGYHDIPWALGARAYAVYSKRHGTHQSLELVNERGGFSPGEMDQFLPGWRDMVAASELMTPWSLMLWAILHGIMQVSGSPSGGTACFRCDDLDIDPGWIELDEQGNLIPDEDLTYKLRHMHKGWLEARNLLTPVGE